MPCIHTMCDIYTFELLLITVAAGNIAIIVGLLHTHAAMASYAWGDSLADGVVKSDSMRK